MDPLLRITFLGNLQMTLSVTTSLCNIGEAAAAVESAQSVTIIRDYFTLFHYYCDYFFNYTHYSMTRKGHTTLSRTKNKKYLPQNEMRNEGSDVTNTLHLPQDWS